MSRFTGIRSHAARALVNLADVRDLDRSRAAGLLDRLIQDTVSSAECRHSLDHEVFAVHLAEAADDLSHPRLARSMERLFDSGLLEDSPISREAYEENAKDWEERASEIRPAWDELVVEDVLCELSNLNTFELEADRPRQGVAAASSRREEVLAAAAEAAYRYGLEADEDAVDTILREAPKIGRNDPCPCGSGKKHKRCCLKKVTSGGLE